MSLLQGLRRIHFINYCKYAFISERSFKSKFFQTVSSIGLFKNLVNSKGELPKGFEKYYPENQKNTSKKSSQKIKESRKSSTPVQENNPFSFKFGDKGSPGGGDPNTNLYFYLFASGVAILGFIGLQQGQYKEITWREFINNYLNRGSVEKLEVRYTVLTNSIKTCVYLGY